MKILKISGIVDFTMKAYKKTISRKQAEAILFNVKLHHDLVDFKHELTYLDGSYYFKLENGEELNIVRDYNKNLTHLPEFTLSPLGFKEYIKRT